MARGGFFLSIADTEGELGFPRHGHFPQTFLQVGQRARASGGVVGYAITGIILPTTDGADEVYYLLLTNR